MDDNVFPAAHPSLDPEPAAMALDPLHISGLLRKFHLKPQKSLGQNFLADHNALLKIVEDSGVGPEDRILEIGAGLGSLTRVLAVKAGSVVAVEIDAHLFPALQSVTGQFDNIVKALINAFP